MQEKNNDELKKYYNIEKINLIFYYISITTN